MIDTKELHRLAQEASPGPWHFWRGWVAADIDNDGGVIIVERPTPSGGKYQARVDSNFKFIAAANPTTISELLDRLEAAESDAAHQNAFAGSAFREAVRWEEKCNALRAEIIHLKEVEFPRKAQAVADGWRGKLEAAEKERDDVAQQLVQSEIGKREISEAHNVAKRRLSALAGENITLQAKIAEMEKQEPVAWMLNCPTLGGDTGWILSWTQSGAGLCNSLQGEENEKRLYALPGAKGD